MEAIAKIIKTLKEDNPVDLVYELTLAGRLKSPDQPSLIEKAEVEAYGKPGVEEAVAFIRDQYLPILKQLEKHYNSLCDYRDYIEFSEAV